MWAWVLLPFEVALVAVAFYFYRKTKQTSDMVHAAQTAWQTEVEAHLRSLVQELETLLDKADAQGVTRQARWFPAAETTPAPATTADAAGPSYTFEHILDDALTEAGEPVAAAAKPVTPPVVVDEAEDPRYQEARRLHAAGFDAVTIARKVGLEREEVQMLLQWSPITDGSEHPGDGAPQETAEQRITSLVEYLRAAEGAAPMDDMAAGGAARSGNGTRARRKTTAPGDEAAQRAPRRRANTVGPKQSPASASGA